MLEGNIGEYISLRRSLSKCTGREESIMGNVMDLHIKTVHESNKEADVKWKNTSDFWWTELIF